MPKTFEQQMIEAEGEIERGIAVACGFSVEEHRALRSAQYILRADVAMHQCNARSCNAIRKITDPFSEVRMLVRSVQQVRLKTEHVELCIIRERLGDTVPARRCRVNAGKSDTHLGCKLRLDNAAADLCLPQTTFRG